MFFFNSLSNSCLCFLGYNRDSQRDQRGSSFDRSSSGRAPSSGGHDNGRNDRSRGYGNDRRDGGNSYGDRGGNSYSDRGGSGGSYNKPPTQSPATSHAEENWDDDDVVTNTHHSSVAPKAVHQKSSAPDADTVNWGLAAEAWASRPKRASGSAAGSVSGTPRDVGRSTPRG